MEKEIKKIIKTLEEANELYHSFGTSSLSDAEYDSLKDRLAVLDPSNKLLKRVGATPRAKSSSKQVEKWEKFDHSEYKMGSQNKVTNKDGLTKWCSKVKVDDFHVVQHKLDGTSIKLIYENGQLIVASTRGDGDTGENITINVKKMKHVPNTILDKRRIVLRGEILLFKSDFDKVGGKNTRNSAAGTAKRLDGVGCEHLSVLIYGIMNWKELSITNEDDSISLASKLNFYPVTSYKCKTIEDIQKVMDEYKNGKRKQLDWDIDGLVIKTNTLDDDEWDYPNRSVAYKFESEEGITKLIDVEWTDTGGRIAPKAKLEPIDLGGVTISAATLNNLDHINKLGVKIGDLVVVSRRNDVIPCIERVSMTFDTSKEIVPPTHDKEGFPIVREKNAVGQELVYLVSTNPNSLSMRKRRILAWYRAHDAKGLGSETIEAIINAGIATDLPDFYDVGLNGHEDLGNLEGFGVGKFKILNKATLLTSKTTVLKFLDGMDMSGFSESRFEAILEHINKETTVLELIKMCFNETFISNIPGFGVNTAKGLKAALIETSNVIDKMLERVEVESWKPHAVSHSSKINGLSFCFTGSMEHDRDVLQKAVKKHGGVIAGVSKNLDYLVISSPNWTSSKVDKANKLGIKSITEKQFIDLINGDI